jgi:chemotaxis signal transduction protein
VITDVSGISVGLLVDSITYVVQAKPHEIDTNGLTNRSGTSEFLSGLCNRSVGVRGILDVEKIVLKVAGGTWPADSGEAQSEDDHS